MPRRSYPPLDADACARLRAARQVQRLRVREVAARAGISATTYHRIETGKRGAPPDTLARIAAALNLDALPEPPPRRTERDDASRRRGAPDAAFAAAAPLLPTIGSPTRSRLRAIVRTLPDSADRTALLAAIPAPITEDAHARDAHPLIVLGDGVLAAAIAVSLSERRRVVWVQRAGGPPPALALAAPGTPPEWLAPTTDLRRRADRAAAWFGALPAGRTAHPSTALLPVMRAPDDPHAGRAGPDALGDDPLRLIVADMRRVWRILTTQARRRAIPVLRAPSATPLIADGRCIGVQTRRRTVLADVVIQTIGLHPQPALWIDPAPPVAAVQVAPDPDCPLGWTIRFPLDDVTYTTRLPSLPRTAGEDSTTPPVPGVTPLHGASRATGIAVARGLITVHAMGSQGLSAIPDLLDTLQVLLP